MKTIIIGEKKDNIKYDFRETCFGICEINNNLYLTKKNNEISLIGGGIERDENYIDCLKREFLEESGCILKKAKKFITIDCYWTTKDNKYMESLSHFYIVKIDKKILKPLEECSSLVIIEKGNVLNLLKLPYQIEGIKRYFNQ